MSEGGRLFAMAAEQIVSEFSKGRTELPAYHVGGDWYLAPVLINRSQLGPQDHLRVEWIR